MCNILTHNNMNLFDCESIYYTLFLLCKSSNVHSLYLKQICSGEVTSLSINISSHRFGITFRSISYTNTKVDVRLTCCLILFEYNSKPPNTFSIIIIPHRVQCLRPENFMWNFIKNNYATALSHATAYKYLLGPQMLFRRIPYNSLHIFDTGSNVSIL